MDSINVAHCKWNENHARIRAIDINTLSKIRGTCIDVISYRHFKIGLFGIHSSMLPSEGCHKLKSRLNHCIYKQFGQIFYGDVVMFAFDTETMTFVTISSTLVNIYCKLMKDINSWII